jgi:hypothetical protein
VIKVKATPRFVQQSQKAMSNEALQALIDHLAVYPESGAVIQGTGGIRKIRWQTGENNKGKSGGVRVLYYYDKNVLIILLITLYKKSDKENIDASEKLQLKKLLPELLRRHGHESNR